MPPFECAWLSLSDYGCEDACCLTFQYKGTQRRRPSCACTISIALRSEGITEAAAAHWHVEDKQSTFETQGGSAALRQSAETQAACAHGFVPGCCMISGRLEHAAACPLAAESTCKRHARTGDNDVTVIFKSVAGSKRWQPLARPRGEDGAAIVEDNYTVILGSHRNSRLKFEKNGEEMELVGLGW